MKKRLAALILVLTPFFGMGSHIVGGEFELLHLADFRYKLNLIIYFDEEHGIPANKEQDMIITARIFRFSDNVLMRDVLIPFISEALVSYTQMECAIGELRTSRMLYSTEITLPPELFSDPQGYYIIWERCCRNYSITNIFSDPPPPNNPNFPTAAGQTFYLHFPPVMKNGQPFIDSTPRLFPPLSDYGCPGKPYYTDFAGTDDDGDSLVYSIVTPLNTHSKAAYPPLLPAPFPEIDWRPGFSLNNIMNGAPDLEISTEGFLTIWPSTFGLYVFAVRCEEFRGGEKIGETRRDFQMLVLQVCPDAEPPLIKGKKTNEINFTYVDNMSVSFANTVTDADRCIQVRISDPDASNPNDFFTENVRIKVIPMNFKGNISDILPAVTTATLTNGSTADFTICFPQCPYFEGGAYQIGIIAKDDACALPLSDTLRLVVDVEPPVNSNPYFVTPDVSETLLEGENRIWPITAHDDDGNLLIVSLVPEGFNPSDAGMTFTFNQSPQGHVTGQLQWDAFCNIYDFTQRTAFKLNVIVDDVDVCNFGDPAATVFNLGVILPGNADPVIDTDLTADPDERTVGGITRKVFESLDFEVSGSDVTDNDFLILDVQGKDFDLADLGITFPSVDGNGEISSAFHWDLTCEQFDLHEKDTFEFQFIVVDNANKCRFYKADTVDVTVNVLPPDNSSPLLAITNLTPEIPFTSNQLSMVLGQKIELNLTGTDADTGPLDQIRLELVGAISNVEPSGYSFSAVEGESPVQSLFSWQPDCSEFRNGIFENTYDFTFRVFDDRCFADKADTVTIQMTLSDVVSTDEDFVPPNFISPNNDGHNDYYALHGIDADADALIALPDDNCINRFEEIVILNRWGNPVYRSDNRNFRWYAPNEAPGVYFFQVRYTNKTYKGSLSVRY